VAWKFQPSEYCSIRNSPASGSVDPQGLHTLSLVAWGSGVELCPGWPHADGEIYDPGWPGAAGKFCTPEWPGSGGDFVCPSDSFFLLWPGLELACPGLPCGGSENLPPGCPNVFWRSSFQLGSAGPETVSESTCLCWKVEPLTLRSSCCIYGSALV